MRWCVPSLLVVACAEPTFIPDEPPPLYGELGGFEQCSAPPRDAGPASVDVVNDTDSVVVLTFVDGSCEEAIVAELQPGEALTWETSLGNVHAVRDADTLYLYAHFRVLSDGPDQVVVP